MRHLQEKISYENLEHGFLLVSALLTQKIMKVGLKTLCCIFVSVSGDLWRSSLCCWDVFQAKLRISCVFFSLEQRKGEVKPLSLVEIKMINELKVN